MHVDSPAEPCDIGDMDNHLFWAQKSIAAMLARIAVLIDAQAALLGQAAAKLREGAK